MVRIYTYTSPKRVAAFLNVAGFSAGLPTEDTVEGYIRRAEDFIDRSTGTSWKLSQRQAEFLDIDMPYEYAAGIPVRLGQRNIQALSATAGDVLEVWNGASYEDWLATKIESRSGDYWLDYKSGVLFIKSHFAWKIKGVRMTYRFCSGARTQVNDAGGMTAEDANISVDSTAGFPMSGTLIIDEEEIYYPAKTATSFLDCTRALNGTTAAPHSNDAVIQWIPEDIVEAANLWVAIRILQNEEKAVIVPDAPDSLRENFSGRLDRWERQLNEILDRNVEWKTF